MIIFTLKTEQKKQIIIFDPINEITLAMRPSFTVLIASASCEGNLLITFLWLLIKLACIV